MFIRTRNLLGLVGFFLASIAVFSLGAASLDQVESQAASENRAEAPRLLIRFYQRVISPVNGSSCQMWPSCSAYSSQAFREHGFVKGFLLTSDRLIRCNPWAGPHYPYIVRDGRVLLSDPLHRNTWWWQKRGRARIVRTAH
ncbi:membrane protein insertion efficiency factor YidD [bacterium]|nr:membrane protein insertion efficiency factor YidD [bacterium]